MTSPDWYAEQFEQRRAHLRAVAYRMLGSVTEAEDAVQETWIRLSRSPDGTIDNLTGWLTTAVGRVCIDMLRARTARRESLTGTWLPEPVVATGESHDPEQQTLLADSVGMALLVVLENLQPSERMAFVLHDMFAVPFEEIATVLEKSPAAVRQLASRARRRVQGSAVTPNPDLAIQRRVVDAFLAAARAGDFEALIGVLDPDVTFRVDSGTRTLGLPPLLSGAEHVALHAATHGPQFATHCEPALVNGAAGLVVRGPFGVFGVVGMTVDGDRIVEIDLILDGEKLAATNAGS